MKSKNRKKFLSIVLTVCMILGVVPMQNLTTYAASLEETTPLTSIWRDGRLGITTGGSASIGTDGSIAVVGAGTQLSKSPYIGTDATKDNMYYDYIKAEGVTTIVTKLSATQIAAGMAGIAIRGDGESAFAPYFAMYFDNSKKEFRTAYRYGALGAGGAYKAGAGAAAKYTTTATTYASDVYVKITFATVAGNTTATYYISTDGTFSDTANGTQVVNDFTPGTVGFFATLGNTVTASNISIERAANTTTGVAAKYFYNSTVGEIKPSFVGDSADLATKVYGDTISINQTAATAVGTAGTSYLMFPATSAMYTMSADVNISAYNTANSSYGVFSGVFSSLDTVANGQGGSTFAMRYSATGPNARGIYTKNTPAAYGAGGMNATYALGTTYNMSITNKLTTMDYAISGETITPGTAGITSTCGWSNVKNFTVGSDGTNVTIAQPVYYGIAFVGVQSTVKNLKLVNSAGVIIYDMNDYYEVASQPPVAGAITAAVNSDRTAIDLTWAETTAAVGKGLYEIAYSTDGGTTYTVAGTTAAKKYSFNSNLATNNYIFKVYGVYKTAVTAPQLSSSVSYVKPLSKVTLSAAGSGNKVDLTWTASAGATSYDVYRADSYTSIASSVLLANVTTASYSDTAVVTGPYYYYVIAKDATNTSNPSDVLLALVGGIYTGAVTCTLSDTIKFNGKLVYEDEAATITFGAVNDTVLTNSQTVSGKVNKAGTIYALCGNTVQSKAVAVDEAFTFTFALAQGRNEVEYLFVDASNNITMKYDNFVYLTSYDLLVDAAFTGVDGTGTVPTYKTISAAVAAVPSTNTEAKVIFIKNGSYQERVDISAPYISLIGEDSLLTYINKSVIVGIAGSTGMTNRNVVAVQAAATGFTAENLTIENTFPYKNGSGEQADALMLNADQAIITNVRLLSFQDTLLTYNQNARQVFYRCYITGNVDFIYGTSTVLFEDCDIVGRYTSYKADGCYVAPQTMKTSTTGYVFDSCRFTSEAGVGESQYRLARTYGEASAALFNQCYLGKAVRHADVLCFEVMNYPLSTARYYESNSFGPAALAIAGRPLVSSSYAEQVFKNMFVTDFSTLPAFDGQVALKLMYKDADYTALKKLIDVINGLIKSNYVDMSAVKAAVDAAVYDLSAAQQSKVDTMVINISDAVNALVLKDADSTSLASAISSAEALTSSVYTSDSYAAVTAALAAAKAVPTGLKIDKQSTIDAAATALANAVAALVNAPVATPTPKTGDSSPITMYMLIMGIAAGTVIYATKKRKIKKLS